MTTISSSGWVIFSIDEQRYGLPCALVKRIVRTVEITAVPNMPAGVLGLINVQGQIILVIDIRQRLGLPSLPYELQDALIITESGQQNIGFIVKAATYVENFETSLTPVEKLIKGVECAEHIVKDKEGMIYILNLEKLLNKQDESLLQKNKNIQKESNA